LPSDKHLHVRLCYAYEHLHHGLDGDQHLQVYVDSDGDEQHARQLRKRVKQCACQPGNCVQQHATCPDTVHVDDLQHHRDHSHKLRSKRHELPGPLDDRSDDQLPSLHDLHHSTSSSISSCQHQHSHDHSGDDHFDDQPGRHSDLIQHGLHDRDANLLHHDVPGLLLDVHERVLHLLVSRDSLDHSDKHLLQHHRAHDFRTRHRHKPVPRRASFRVFSGSGNNDSPGLVFASERREPDELGCAIVVYQYSGSRHDVFCSGDESCGTCTVLVGCGVFACSVFGAGTDSLYPGPGPDEQLRACLVCAGLDTLHSSPSPDEQLCPCSVRSCLVCAGPDTLHSGSFFDE